VPIHEDSLLALSIEGIDFDDKEWSSSFLDQLVDFNPLQVLRLNKILEMPRLLLQALVLLPLWIEQWIQGGYPHKLFQSF